MPRGDGTGPMGMGPMTGRGTGYCAGYAGGFGYGRGRGFRRMFYPMSLPGGVCFGNPAYTGTKEADADEKERLNNQVKFLENQLQQVKKRLVYLQEEAK